MTQAEPARRLNKSPKVISRSPARPTNWEADTFGDLLFGISGAVPAYRIEHPLSGEAAGTATKGLLRRSQRNPVEVQGERRGGVEVACGESLTSAPFPLEARPRRGPLVARVAFRDPWIAPALRWQACRFRQKSGTEEGAILSHRHDPEKWLPVFGQIMPIHFSEDANDQAP